MYFCPVLRLTHVAACHQQDRDVRESWETDSHMLIFGLFVRFPDNSKTADHCHAHPFMQCCSRASPAMYLLICIYCSCIYSCVCVCVVVYEVKRKQVKRKNSTSGLLSCPLLSSAYGIFFKRQHVNPPVMPWYNRHQQTRLWSVWVTHSRAVVFSVTLHKLDHTPHEHGCFKSHRAD